MVVQRVTPAGGTNSRIEGPYRPAFRKGPVAVPAIATTIAEQIQQLPNDYQRAVFCREQAEASRRQWFAGRLREIAYVMAKADAGDARFRNMTHAQLEITARWRWSQSSRGQYLTKVENKFTAWAQMYLSFAEVEALSQRGVPPR